jgi:hypothetical protein
MDRTWATRILLGLAAALFTTGCALGAVGMHPAVQRTGLARLGFFMAIASQPMWMTVTSWRAQDNLCGKVSDERLAGYQMCVEQLAEDPEYMRQLIVHVPRQTARSPQPGKRSQ